METSRIDPVALLAAILAVILAATSAHGEFGYLSSIAGLTLLLVLFAYDQRGYRSGWQSLAFAAVSGLCVVPASSVGLALYLAHVNETVLAIVWAVATVVFSTIDRVRMGSRAPNSLLLSGAGDAAPIGFVSQKAPITAPPEPSPFVPEPAPAAFVPPAAPEPPPPPAAVPVPPGKETEIFVSLIGEGLNVLRRVRAEHLGRDFYRIIDEMPEGENWQFQPGQVVRCRKTKLSSGKSLVAFEEAPRAT
jgi:hypothetical protein